MAYQILGRGEGWQPIADTSTTQNHRIGQRVDAWDDTYGYGQFIYLKGVASTAIGDLVFYDAYTPDTTRAVQGTKGMCAVAMSANVASQYGWYQIFGQAVIACDTTAADAPLYIDGTTGRVDDAVSATNLINGALSLTADGTPAANFLVAQIAYPHCNGLG